MNFNEYIESHTLRCEASYRGGGIEIDLTDMFPNHNEPKMTAYQNYLGGGLLGSVQSDANFAPRHNEKRKFQDIQTALKKYFHNLTNEGLDEWSESDYQANQARPVSGF